jgi:hypothetical protein
MTLLALAFVAHTSFYAMPMKCHLTGQICDAGWSCRTCWRCCVGRDCFTECKVRP